MIDITPKIIIFGDASSGKSVFIQKFLKDLFVSDQTMTIGVDFYTKNLTIDDRIVKLQIWIFGGEERFKFLLSSYVRGSLGGLLLYDVTDRSSIANIDDWLGIIRKEIRIEDKFPILAVGFLPEERNERQISIEEGMKLAKSKNLNGYIECNLKTGKNVEGVFEALVRLILSNNRIYQK